MNQIDLLSAFMAKEFLTYFDVKEIVTIENRIDIYLDEKPHKLEGYDEKDLCSKGFRDAVIIQDFPIRNKARYLHVRQRKWQVKSTGQIVCRNWKLVAKGTSLTTEFATF